MGVFSALKKYATLFNIYKNGVELNLLEVREGEDGSESLSFLVYS